MASITVLYFAVARERVGLQRETIEIADGARVHQVLDLLAQKHPALARIRPHLRVAVDQEFANEDTQVGNGAELALIPPVSGGSGAFRVTDLPLSLDEVVRAVSGPGLGGIVTFTGAVRDQTHGRHVVRLEYEAYGPMAEKKLEEIASEALGKWPGSRLAITHRVGVLMPGEWAVVMAAAAPHRDAAFQVCRYAIERLKQDVPIWKKEFFADGVVWVGMGP